MLKSKIFLSLTISCLLACSLSNAEELSDVFVHPNDGFKEVMKCSDFLATNFVDYTVCRNQKNVPKKIRNEIYSGQWTLKDKYIQESLKLFYKYNIKQGDWVNTYQFNSDGFIYPNFIPDNSIEIYNNGGCIFRDALHKKGKGFTCIPLVLDNKLYIFNGEKNGIKFPRKNWGIKDNIFKHLIYGEPLLVLFHSSSDLIYFRSDNFLIDKTENEGEVFIP